MKKSIIDRETAQRIIDTADIVEVVSDFVTLRRRGANYVGLCPFHNERTPSFSVSRAKGICKCFSCGKAGSAVWFVMEHEQMSYWEALRYLANKYHIEIKERELTDEDRREMTQRQGMLDVNEFALKHFEHNLNETPDGRDIGLSYFLHRGINEWAIKRFRLGYSIDRRDDLVRAARSAGLNEQYLLDTGLVIRNDRGDLYDRFRARVMYPVFTIAGKVVAFGGRTLSSDKKMAKYVNSPESMIYSKSHELYGLYQAKQAIAKHDKCILVEGYMDVISMHQRGVENVVASSGTSLTRGQIRLIHRFTQNVTVIYDSDPAGIKASLRGIDLLLAEGMNIKVLLLPDGDDPDSFAQSHTAEEVEQYLADHEVDFIRFKTDILLKDAKNDPVQRANVIESIVESIAVIPREKEIVANVYMQECAMRFGMEERVLLDRIARKRLIAAENLAKEEARAKAMATLPPEVRNPENDSKPIGGPDDPTVNPQPASAPAAADNPPSGAPAPFAPNKLLEPQERALLQLVLRYGMMTLDSGNNGESIDPTTVIDYIRDDMAIDNISFTNPAYQKVFDYALMLKDSEWEAYWQQVCTRAEAEADRVVRDGREELNRSATNMQEISGGEQRLQEAAQEAKATALRQGTMAFFPDRMTSHPDDDIRRVACDLIIEKHTLSKIFTKGNVKILEDVDRLGDLVSRATLALKYDTARMHYNALTARIAALQSAPGGYDLNEILDLMAQQQRWQNFYRSIAPQLGDRVYEPLRRN